MYLYNISQYTTCSVSSSGQKKHTQRIRVLFLFCRWFVWKAVNKSLYSLVLCTPLCVWHFFHTLSLWICDNLIWIFAVYFSFTRSCFFIFSILIELQTRKNDACEQVSVWFFFVYRLFNILDGTRNNEIVFQLVETSRLNTLTKAYISLGRFV